MTVRFLDPQADHHRRRTVNNGGERPTTAATPNAIKTTLPTPTPSHIASPQNPTLVQPWLAISLAVTTTATPVTTVNQMFTAEFCFPVTNPLLSTSFYFII